MAAQSRNKRMLRLQAWRVTLCSASLGVVAACGAASSPAPDFSDVRERAARTTGAIQPRSNSPVATPATQNAGVETAPQAASAPAWDPSDPNLIVGFGEGPTVDAARSSAVAQVARQVRSELVASFSIETAGTLQDSETRVREEVSERATFDRTDLVATDAASATCARGVCRVTAALDRSRALAQLIDELGPEMSALESAVIALEAAPAATAAAAPWSRASSAWQALAPSLPLLDAIAGGTSSLSRDARELWAVATDRVTTLVGATPARVRTAETSADAIGAPLESALRDAWASRGGPLSAACEGVELVLSPEVECSRGYVGSQCVLRGDLELRACAGARVSTAVDTSAARRVAVLDARVGEELDPSLGAYVADVLRAEAQSALESGGSVMTRENILAMLPPDTSWASCTEADCEVEFGRRIAADVVVSAELRVLAGQVRLNVVTHDAASGQILDGRRWAGANSDALIIALEREADTWARTALDRDPPHQAPDAGSAEVVIARASLDGLVVSAHPSSEERARADLSRDLVAASLDAWLIDTFGGVWPFL